MNHRLADAFHPSRIGQKIRFSFFLVLFIFSMIHCNRNQDHSVPMEGEWHFLWDQLLLEDHPFGEKVGAPELGCRFQWKEKTAITYLYNHTEYSPCKGYKLQSQAESILTGEASFEKVEAGHSWNGYRLESGDDLGRQGNAVYRLTLDLEDENFAVFTKTQASRTNLRLWMKDGEELVLLARIANPGWTEETSQESVERIRFSIPKKGKVELYWEVSNFQDRDGGVASQFYLGDIETVLREEELYTWQEVILAGLILMAGIYHLFLYFLRRDLKAALWFGITCVIVAIRTLILIRLSQELGWSFLSYELIYKIEYNTIPLGGIVFVMYLYYILQKQVHIWFYGIAIGFGLAMTVFNFFAPLFLVTTNLPITQISVVILLILSFYELIRKLFSPNRELKLTAKWILFFMVVIALAIVNDLLLYNGIVILPDSTQYGLLIFIFGQGMIIARMNARAWEKSETLTKSLQEEIEIRTQLQRTKENLETKKEESERNLKEAINQLIQSEKLSSLGAMISGIAHEIANPVNYSKIATQNLEKQLNRFDATLQEMAEEDEEVKREFQEKFSDVYDFIRDMKLGLETVQHINTSMRNASRSDLEKVPSDLREICDEACLILGAKLKMHSLEKDYPDGLPFVNCHRSQIGQVVMNFLGNANDAITEYFKRKDNPSGSGKIRVSMRVLESIPTGGSLPTGESAREIAISVADTGIGIPEESKSKVLDAFYTTKPAGKGTGLGLAICGKIADSHGGRIEIGQGLLREDGGYGTEFSLVIPM